MKLFSDNFMKLNEERFHLLVLRKLLFILKSNRFATGFVYFFSCNTFCREKYHGFIGYLILFREFLPVRLCGSAMISNLEKYYQEMLIPTSDSIKSSFLYARQVAFLSSIFDKTSVL